MIFSPVEIRTTLPSEVSTFHSLLSGWKQTYDTPVMGGPYAFYSWWEREVDYALTALDEVTGEIVGCGYLTDLKEPYSACFHIFKKKGYLNPMMVAEICSQALPLIFKNCNIEKLIAIFPADRKDVYRLGRFVGMKKDGVLRNHWFVDGKWVDCYIMSILRKEVGKWAVANLLHFQPLRLLRQLTMRK